MLADVGLTRDDLAHAVRHGKLPNRAAERAGQ
jgi:hypothetical protein